MHKREMVELLMGNTIYLFVLSTKVCHIAFLLKLPLIMRQSTVDCYFHNNNIIQVV